MKKISKVLVVVTLTILLAANTLGVYALQSFTDVADNHWAREYIETMSERKIITGYPDATFRPSESVDKLATMVMISRTLNATNKLIGTDLNSLVEKYSLILNQYNVPQWGRQAVALGLEKNIIDGYDVEDFFKDDGTLKKATRTEVAVLLGKSLNLYLNEELKNTIITFDFNDAEFIPAEDAPYVNLLIRKNVIKGDENGNFNPDKPIDRAAVAKMFSGFYDILSGIAVDISADPNTDINDDDDTDVDDEDLVVKEGKIALVLQNESKIVVSDDEDKNSLYKVENDTKIVIQDRISSINYLQEGESIELYIDENGKLVKVEVDSDIVSFEGTIESIINMGSYYLITVKDEDSDKERTFKANDDTVILLNDEEAEIKELNRDDNVLFTVDGNDIEKIIAESDKRVYEGILESNITFSQQLTMKIRTYTQKTYELEIDPDVDVEKNNRNKKLTDLVKGDIITAKTKNGKVVEIEATSIEVSGKVEGTITEITLGSEDKISIEDEDGEISTYVISPDVDIEIDDDDAEVYDLKPDYDVELRIEDGVVTDIDAEEVEASYSCTGIITEIFDDYEAITLRIKDGSDTNYLSISVEDAEILTTSGRSRGFSYLDEGDEVFIYGDEGNKIFDVIADKVIILQQN